MKGLDEWDSKYLNHSRSLGPAYGYYSDVFIEWWRREQESVETNSVILTEVKAEPLNIV